MSENQNNQGAPSSDNTSALFVSARKKQLAQQEQERIAAEKEAARIAAEEEVRRLEQDVEQRKLRAQEDAFRIEQENEARRRQADMTQAGPINPQYGQVATGSTFGNAAVSTSGGLFANKQLLIIIASSVAVLILFIIVMVAIFSGGSKPVFTYNMDENSYIVLNEDGTAEGVTPDMTEFEGGWYVEGNIVHVDSENYTDDYYIIDDNTIYLERFEGEFVFNAE